MKTRLGKRLTTLFNAIPPGYDAIWDLCCDHGRLGMALLETRRARRVHFVDRVPTIMAELEQRLVAYGADGYRLHSQDAGQVTLPPTGHHLLVLSGVGDEVTSAILTAITAHNPGAQPDWLIGPANNVFQVRHYLRRQGFGLLDEGVVFDNSRGYEWLKVTANRQRAPEPVPITATFWDARRDDHRAHLTRLVRHGRRQLRNGHDANAGAMLAHYQPLLEPATD